MSDIRISQQFSQLSLWMTAGNGTIKPSTRTRDFYTSTWGIATESTRFLCALLLAFDGISARCPHFTIREKKAEWFMFIIKNWNENSTAPSHHACWSFSSRMFLFILTFEIRGINAGVTELRAWNHLLFDVYFVLEHSWAGVIMLTRWIWR